MPSRLGRWAPFLAPLIIIVAYARMLGAPFVWDDRHLIVDSPAVQNLAPLSNYFETSFWNSNVTGDHRAYYRPLTVLSFAFDHVVHGNNPAGFHLTNIVLHALNVLLLYFLMRRYRVAYETAFALSVLWGLLPRLTEAAAWIAGRTDLLATFFVLVALLIYRPERATRVVVASLVIFVGLFAKEVAIAGAVAIAAVEIIRRKHAFLAVFPIALSGIFVTIRSHVLRDAPAIEHALGFGKRMILALASVGEYARMIVFPWRPELQIGVGFAPGIAMPVVGALVTVALAVIAFRMRHVFLRRRTNVQPLVVLGIALAATGLALVLHIVPLAVNVIAADRFLYLPTLGLALAIAPYVELARFDMRSKTTVGLALSISFFACTFMRLADWNNEIDLWIKTFHQTPPENAVPLNELGSAYFRAGLYVEAAAIYKQASHFHAKSARANHANAIGELGDYDAAAEELADLCHRYTDVADHCLFAGFSDLRRMRFDSARTFIHLAIDRAGGNYPEATQAFALAAHVEALANAHDPFSMFEFSILTGRRPEALATARAILETPNAPRPLRTQAAAYWAEFGTPRDLASVLEVPSAHDVVDARMLDAIHFRERTAEELLQKWPQLGITP